jgi:hypothetical protein
MKKSVFLFAVMMAFASLSFAQGRQHLIDMRVIVGDRSPAPEELRMMRAEEANHPNIAKALHNIEKSMNYLQAAPDEFGGHKAQAQADLKQAWISLRKALYFRLYADTH